MVDIIGLKALSTLYSSHYSGELFNQFHDNYAAQILKVYVKQPI